MTLHEISELYAAKGIQVSVSRAGARWPVWVDFDPESPEPEGEDKQSVVRFDSEADLRKSVDLQVDLTA